MSRRALFIVWTAAVSMLGGCSDWLGRDNGRRIFPTNADAHIPDFGCFEQPDPDTVPDTLAVRGFVNAPGIPGVTPDVLVANARVQGLVQGGSFVSAITDQDGNFELIGATGGTARDTWMEVTNIDYFTTTMYSPRPLAVDIADLEVPMTDADTLDLLAREVGTTQDPDLGIVAIGVVDCDLTFLAGATVSVDPPGTDIIYNDATGVPSSGVTETGPDGIAFIFNVPLGEVEVGAQLDTMTFRAHTVVVKSVASENLTVSGVGP